MIGLHTTGGTIDEDVALRVTAGVTGRGYEDLAAALCRALELPPARLAHEQ
jgi:hypothetical protein